jgi:Leucine-rich repeat (LRR) protein
VTIKAEKKPIRLKGLAGLPLTFLSCQQAEVDLDDLGSMNTLKYLDLNGSTVKRLAALSRFAVETLNLSGTGVERIDALKSLPTLRKLDLANNPVADLTPLRGLPIEYLDITDCKNVVDIAALADLPLKELRCTYQPAFKSLKDHKTLKQINMKPRDEFFKE